MFLLMNKNSPNKLLGQIQTAVVSESLYGKKLVQRFILSTRWQQDLTLGGKQPKFLFEFVPKIARTSWVAGDQPSGEFYLL